VVHLERFTDQQISRPEPSLVQAGGKVGRLSVPTFHQPDEQLDHSDSDGQNPSAFHTEHDSIILHLLCEALDYVERAHRETDFEHLRTFRCT
jgi:hypothetical protein